MLIKPEMRRNEEEEKEKDVWQTNWCIFLMVSDWLLYIIGLIIYCLYLGSRIKTTWMSVTLCVSTVAHLLSAIYTEVCECKSQPMEIIV
jgi:hypothetical protein